MKQLDLLVVSVAAVLLLLLAWSLATGESQIERDRQPSEIAEARLLPAHDTSTSSDRNGAVSSSVNSEISHPPASLLTVGPKPRGVASASDISIDWWVVAAGAVDGRGQSLHLLATIGQGVIGEGASSKYLLRYGYWAASNGAGGCCQGRVGDVNQSGNDEPTIGDISTLIDAKFITGSCDGVISCFAEADINQSGGPNPTCNDITIGDISILIDYSVHYGAFAWAS